MTVSESVSGGALLELARKAHKTLEPLHVVAYFSPESAAAYKAVGAKGLQAYFGVRSAPMGVVAPEVVVSTFYNFAPYLVARAIPSVWDVTTPEELTEARYDGVDATYRRILGDDVLASSEMVEAAAIAREAASDLSAEGRPLFAGHARLDWPETPHLQLFHAQTLLREHRGDGHIAALVLARLDGLEALITHLGLGHGSSAGMPEQMVRATRGWNDEDWDAGLARARERGLIDADNRCTDAGLALRDAIEAQTDAAATQPYERIGVERTNRLRDLARPWSRAISEQLFGGAS
jgi:hypothetical protein